MVFVDYDIFLTYTACIGMLLLGFGVYRSMKAVRSVYARVSGRLFAAGLVAFSSLLLLAFVGCGTLGGTNSHPVFSPDHRHAARVSDFDYGATGGDTSVSVLETQGFRSATVLYGPWKIVEAEDVSWKTDSEVLIQFRTITGYDPPSCTDFGQVKVTCVPRSN